MNNDQLDDLKQFIDSKISQSEERLRSEISNEISSAIQGSEKRLRGEIRETSAEIRTEMAAGFRGVAEAFNELDRDNQSIKKQQVELKSIVDDHTVQLKTLQQKIA